ncbi:ZNF665 [Branchiostoma lanceolatum]|uniref:ZNF665 protein n=1 Tax=Branchiostoma lanceolatum TaxID=7740 RepID=A0A8J9ZBQ5_BRALA|nr:ZNF665 [Branchiostoma lanceolatum]
MATTEGAKICGFCKEVTLAVLPRLHLEELLLELGRRNIMVGESYKKESLVSKLWFFMIKEFQGTDRSVIPDVPTAATGTSSSSAAEQRNMWVTLSNDLQELMETVTSTNSTTNIVPAASTANNAQSNGSSRSTSSTLETSPTKSTNPTLTQPSTSVTMTSPQRLPIFAQEVIVETTAGTSPRRSARLHTLETQASSSSVRNLGETLEESTLTKEGLGKGYLKRELRAVTVTRSKSCSVGSNTVVTDLGAIRELVDEDGDDTNAAEDEEEDGVSSDDDAPMDDDDDSDWQPDSPLEDREAPISSDREAGGKDSSSGLPEPFEEVATDSQGEVSTPPSGEGTTNQHQGPTQMLKCPDCDFTTASKLKLEHHKTSHDKTRIFTCCKCDYRGHKKAHLQEHMKFHTREKVYNCKECDFTCKFRAQLSLHMKHAHGAPGSQGALCEQCGYRAETPYLLKLHKYKHTGERPYKCSLCAFAARHRSTLERHGKISHPGKNCYKCSYCNHFAETKSLLRKHEKTHKAEHLHKCPVRSCPISSNNREELVAHLARSHKKSQEYSCPACDHKTYLLRELKEHMKTHGHEKIYKCDKCVFTAKTWECLRNHKARHNRTKKFKCDKCDFSSAFKSVLVTHTRVHGDNPFQCLHCEFQAGNQTDLSIHLGKHANTITCDMCGYIANTKERLEQHIEEHSTAHKIYSCTACDFATPDQPCLVRHMTSHDLDRQFPCDHCDYRAKKKEVLAVHMRLHTGEKPLKCSKCDFATSLGHALRTHERRHMQGLI